VVGETTAPRAAFDRSRGVYLWSHVRGPVRPIVRRPTSKQQRQAAYVTRGCRCRAACVIGATFGLLAFGVLLPGAPAPASAQAGSRLKLQWNAPAHCPDRGHALAAIDSALGPADGRSGAPAVVRVTITQTGEARWTADIWMYDATGSGERSVAGSSCDQVAQAATLIVALAMATSNEVESNAAQQARAPGAAAHPETNYRLRSDAGVRVLGDTGSLPEPDLGLALTLGLGYRRLRAELDLSGWLPRLAAQDHVATRGGRFFLYTAALRGCVDLLNAADGGGFSLGPCLSAEAGATAGRGFGLSVRHTENVFWGAGLVGFSVRYLAAAPLWLGMLGEFGLPFHRPAWKIDDLGTVFQPGPWLGRVSLGAGWQFP
jgi:hypothetical protein